MCWLCCMLAFAVTSIFPFRFVYTSIIIDFQHVSHWFQGTNNQLALLEKMNDRVAQEYSNYGDVAAGLRVFVEQLNKKSRGFDEYVSQIDAIDQQVTEFEAVVSMLDKHVALLEKKVKSAYHISSSTQWFLIQNSGSFANTWAYPRNVCYILEMLIFQHRNDAVRSQVVHLCCSNCRAFVASSQQLDFCQELDAWDLHRPDLRALIIIAYCFHKKPVPVDFWRTGLAAVCSTCMLPRFLQIFQSVESAARDWSMTCGGPGIESRGSEILELDDFTCSSASHASSIIADCAGTWTDYQMQVFVHVLD